MRSTCVTRLKRLCEVDAVLAHLEPDGREREAESQGAVPGLAKLLVVIVHLSLSPPWRSRRAYRDSTRWMEVGGRGMRIGGGGGFGGAAAGWASISPFSGSLGLGGEW